VPKNLADLKTYITRIKPWAAVALALGLGLVAYYGYEGVRYWQAAERAEALQMQRVVLDRTLDEKLRPGEVLTAELELERTEMERLELVFHHPQTDELIGTVTDVARRSKVVLSSVSAGESSTVTEEGVRYQLQPMSIILEGENQDVYRFFASLRQALPVLHVVNVRLTGGGILPAQVNAQLSFYLSPQVLTDEEIKQTVKKGGSAASSAKPGASGEDVNEDVKQQDAK
jgi:hypothetical protein